MTDTSQSCGFCEAHGRAHKAEVERLAVKLDNAVELLRKTNDCLGYQTSLDGWVAAQFEANMGFIAAYDAAKAGE